MIVFRILGCAFGYLSVAIAVLGPLAINAFAVPNPLRFWLLLTHAAICCWVFRTLMSVINKLEARS